MLPVAPPVEGRFWLTTAPIPWPELRDRIVVVLFWSYGCEASLAAVRRLQHMAEDWPDDVTVVAVHTPRFPYEEDRIGVEAAVARHRIDLPVVHDPDYLTWNRYSPEGWPATAVVNRAGRVVGINAGTTGMGLIGEAVATELARNQRRAGSNLPGPRIRARSGLADRAGRGSTLRFPSGVAVNRSGTVVVADSGHDRLLIGELDHDLRTLRPKIEITDVANPTAVAWAPESVLYVVERGSGSVLQLDIRNGTLDVLTDHELASPCALLVDEDGSLVVADAVGDRLVRVTGGDDGEIVIGAIAGSGHSGGRDGNAGQAELAQPVALARTSTGIVFCDAATSNVRLLTDEGKVVTVTGNDLFEWGLIDGPAHRARLQRPSGLCALDDGSVVIVDTGNDRLRLLRDRRITTLGLAGLNRPTAVAGLRSGHLIVADTGNHRLVVADPAMKTGWPLAVYPAAMTTVWDPAARP